MRPPIPSDTELLDHLERLMCDALQIDIKRIWTTGYGPKPWNVSIHHQFDGPGGHAWGMGGGRGVREALWHAISDQKTKQDVADVDAVIAKLET